MKEIVRDLLLTFPGLSLNKLSNAAKVLGSYYAARTTKSPDVYGMPISISFEPTTSCNLGCPECPSGLKKFTRPTGHMTPDLFAQTLLQLREHLVWANFYFQGEPFLNPAFLEMVSMAAKAGIYTSTSTNAHFLRTPVARATVDSGLHRLIVSIDGTTQEVYESYRQGGSLEKAFSGVENLLAARQASGKKTPFVVLQFLATSANEHQIPEVRRLGKAMGVDDVRIKTAQFYNYRNGHPLMPANEKYSRYRKDEKGSYTIKNPLYNHCWKMWHSCVITWDGLVVPCCFDKDAKHVLGDLKVNTFKEIWKGEKYISFRKSLLNARSQIDICTNCTEGTKVWA